MRVLIIEDEALVSMLLEEMLGELGHEVIGICSTQSTATAAAEETNADLAVLDLNLGGQRADAALEILLRRGVPVIIASGYGAFAEKATAAVLLPKPFTDDDLHRAILQAFPGSR